MEKRNIRLYSTIPFWFYCLHLLFIILPVAAGVFVANGIVLFVGIALLRVPKKASTFLKMIWKIWLNNFLGIVIFLILLWVVGNIQVWEWFNRIFVFIEVILLPGAASCFLNYRFTLNRMEISKRSKVILSLSLTIFTFLPLYLYFSIL